MRHTQLHDTGNFLAEAHATGAMDTAAHFAHADQRAHVFDSHHALFFLVARRRITVADRQVLQLAFAALVADGAIQGVVDEQKLHHRLLRLDSFIALGANHHALGHRRRAGRHGLGGFFDVHQTHAAIGRNTELLVVTKMGDVRTRLFGGVHHHAAFEHFHFFTVEFDFNHGGAPQT